MLLPSLVVGLNFVLVDLTGYFNNDGVAFGSNVADGNFDGGGFVYAAEALPQQGRFEVAGVPFVLPRYDEGLKNNVACSGQRVEVPKGHYACALLLCSAAVGDTSGLFRAIYGDGSASEALLTVTDWCFPPRHGEFEAWVCKFRYHNERGLDNARPRLFVVPVLLDPTKELSALELPDLPPRRTIHIFALTLCKSEPFVAQLPYLLPEIRLGGFRFKFVGRREVDLSGPEVDDSGWEVVSPEHRWQGEGQMAWYRLKFALPEILRGRRLLLFVEADDEAEVYINGRHVAHVPWSAEVPIPGDATRGPFVLIAIRVKNHGGPGRLIRAYLKPPGELRRLGLSLKAARLVWSELLGREGEPIPPEVYNRAARLWDEGKRGQALDEIKRAVAALEGMDEEAKRYTLLLFGHSHIDCEWLWTIEETARVVRDNFRKAIEYAEELGYIYVQSQPALYKLLEETDPGLFERVKEAVRKGRIVPVGGSWVENDNNMPCGEALVRQFLYGKRYFREKFGVDTEVAWFPDTFGHSANLPTILRHCGMRYFVFHRCAPMEGPFLWEGLSGARVIAVKPPGGYSWTGIGRRPGAVVEALSSVKRYGLRVNFLNYGVGDHGGLPPKEDIREALSLDKLRPFPHVRFGRPEEFFAEAEKVRHKLPLHKGEMNFTFQGCYTTHSNAKFMNRQCEHKLIAAEAAASLAFALAGKPYPREALREAWLEALFNQFHDILPGSSIPPVYARTAKARWERALKTADRLMRSSLLALAESAKTSGEGKPVLVFNPLSWSRGGLVEVPARGLPRDCVAVDGAGRVVPVQIEGEKALFVAFDLPPVGYKVFWLRGRRPGDDAALAGVGRATVKGDVLTNGIVTAEVDRGTGTLRRLLVGDRDFIRPGALDFDLREDIGDAWSIGHPAHGGYTKPSTLPRLELSPGAEVRVLRRGPVVASLEVVRTFRGSTLRLEVAAVMGLPYLVVKFSRDWRDDCADVLVRLTVPTTLDRAEARFEVPFGNVAREASGDEYPKLRWFGLFDGKGGRGLAVLDDGRYGCSADGATLYLSLLRDQRKGPDPGPEDPSEGSHVLTVALYPFLGAHWMEAAKRAWELNFPPVAVPAEPREGALPATFSLLSVKGAFTSAVKMAEDENSLVVRLYNPLDRPSEAVVSLGVRAKKIAPVDGMEEESETLEVTPLGGGRYAVKLPPFGLAALKFRM